MPICKLCQENEADKTNSHIIPRFMGKRLFESKKRHAIKLTHNKAKHNTAQSTPKENYILCSGCEKRLAYLETYFSKEINRINGYQHEKTRFNIKNTGTLQILECLEINMNSAKLFFFSLIWRASISKLEGFQNFKLEKGDESILRDFLNDNLKNSHSELLENFNKMINIPAFHFCIIKPKVRNQFSRGIFTSYKISENQYGIFTVDFILYFYTKENSIPVPFKFASNKNSEKLIIPLFELDHWNKINDSVKSRFI